MIPTYDRTILGNYGLESVCHHMVSNSNDAKDNTVDKVKAICHQCKYHFALGNYGLESVCHHMVSNSNDAKDNTVDKVKAIVISANTTLHRHGRFISATQSSFCFARPATSKIASF